jgi:hypothetical protein
VGGWLGGWNPPDRPPPKNKKVTNFLFYNVSCPLTPSSILLDNPRMELHH